MRTFPELPAALERPRAGEVDILVIAGEHSGDQHAAEVVRSLRQRQPGLRMAALGGPCLRTAGAQLLLDMTAFSAVGLVEVLTAYPFYRRLFSRIEAWCLKWRPRLVLLVDYPGLNLRLAESLRRAGFSRQGGGTSAVLQYVSPQIWAWKDKRRFSMAKTLDGVGAIFPFEPACYADTSLPARFVGHPFVEAGHQSPIRYDANGPILLLPGSRPKPVRRIFPVLLEAFARHRERDPTRRAVVLHTGGTVHAELYRIYAEAGARGNGIDFQPVGETPVGASAALVSSGTMSLTVALAGIPGAVVYKAHPLTWAWGQRMIRGKVSFLGMANLLLNREAWPELLQAKCTPEILAARLALCVGDTPVARAAAADAAELQRLLAAHPGSTPAEWVLEHLRA
jgi:lipid-A-disaccharide synthase